MLFYPHTQGVALRVGVFDSGVGGLSVLRALHELLPDAALHCVADSAHTPYGERDEAYVVERSTRIASHLVDRGAELIVMACNTATAVAVQPLRERWPALAIVGVEPGIKPAIALSRNGRIGVMATAGTLASAKFRRLMQDHAHGIQLHLQACTDLAAAIERGELDDPALLDLIETHCRPLRDARVDTVVLGCTHYAFVRSHIQAALGADVQIVDTALAVARRAAGLLEMGRGVMLERGAPAEVLLETTGDPMLLQHIARRWLDFDCRVTAMPEEVG